MEGRSLLIVDCDPEVNLPLACVFQHNDYSVHITGSAKEALFCLRKRRYNLMILEVSLPDSDGICFLSMVRRLNYRLPVLILTGYLSAHAILRAHKLGVYGYLTKPVDPHQILMIAKHIRMEEWRRTHQGREKTTQENTSFAV